MPTKKHQLQEISKGSFTITKEIGKSFTQETIRTSALVRMADGLDKIGTGIQKLGSKITDAEFERDCWKDKYRALEKKYKARGYEIAVLKGAATKAKNKTASE